MLGDDLAVFAAQTENVIMEKGNTSFLSIGIEEDGRMTLSAKVLDSSNNRIVTIVENEFQANPDYAFNPKQPDIHSLIVRDRDGVEVLNVKYLNSKVIRVVGRFQLSGYSEPVLILPAEGLRWPGGGGIGHLSIDMTKSKGGLIRFP
jgi:hypothetical protein